MLVVWLLALALPPIPGQPRAGAEERPVAVLPLVAAGVDAETAGVFEGLVLIAADEACRLPLLEAADIRAALGRDILERASACKADEVPCLNEISSALGVRRLLRSTLTGRGDQLILSLTVVDQEDEQVRARDEVRLPWDGEAWADAVATLTLDVLSAAGLGPWAEAPPPGAAPPTAPPSAGAPRRPAPASPAPAASTSALAALPLAESDAAPPAAPLATREIAAWVLAGGAAAFLATGAVVLATSPSVESIQNNQYQVYLEAQSRPAAEAAYLEVRGAVERHNAATVAGWILLGAGVATAAGAVVLFVARPGEVEVTAGAAVGEGGGGVLFGGRF